MPNRQNPQLKSLKTSPRPSQRLKQKPNSRVNLGAKGERQAAAFLLAKNWRLLAQNLRVAGGEIDLLMQDPTGTVVIVEVKTRQGDYLPPQANITPAKIRTLHRLAHAISDRYPTNNVQVDILEIVESTKVINHIPNILQ